MKTKLIIKTLALFLFPVVVLGADYITRDMIPRGTDFPSVRCDGGIVYREDLARDASVQTDHEKIAELYRTDADKT